MSGARAVARAGALGGLVGAVLVATPLLNAVNYCCCALIVVSGFLAARLLRADDPQAGTAPCAGAGLVAGTVAGLVGTPLGALLSRLAFGAARLESMLQETLEAFRVGAESSGQALPPGMMDAFESVLRATSGLAFDAWLVVATLFSCVAFAFFGLIGGLVGAAGSRGRTPVPPSPQAPAADPVSPAPAEPDGTAGPPSAAPALPPRVPAPPADSAPPVLDEDGQPDVRWDGPVLEAEAGAEEAETPQASEVSGEPPPDADPAAAGPPPARGEIPQDELPLLPRPPQDDDARRQG